MVVTSAQLSQYPKINTTSDLNTDCLQLSVYPQIIVLFILNYCTFHILSIMLVMLFCTDICMILGPTILICTLKA